MIIILTLYICLVLISSVLWFLKSPLYNKLSIFLVKYISCHLCFPVILIASILYFKVVHHEPMFQLSFVISFVGTNILFLVSLLVGRLIKLRESL